MKKGNWHDFEYRVCELLIETVSSGGEKIRTILAKQAQKIDILQLERAQLFRDLDELSEENRVIRQEIEYLRSK